MKQYADYIVKAIIEEELKKKIGNKYIFCISSIEDAEVYYDICIAMKQYCSTEGIVFNAKLATKKYEQFNENTKFSGIVQLMLQADWVDTGNQMTRYRNFIPEDDQTYVILLMGTESIDDKGGLADFFAIDAEYIDSTVGKEYHALFGEYKNRFADSQLFFEAFNVFYGTLFKNVEKDIPNLCRQIDSWVKNELSENEIWIEMFRSLPECWEVPFISKAVPSIGSTQKRLAILSNACEFIRRKAFIKPSKATIKKIEQQFDNYEKEQKEYATDYPSGQAIASFEELRQRYVEFAKNINVDENRKMFLETDYSIIDAIIKTKIQPTVIVDEKSSKLYGDPLNAFLKAFLTVATAKDVFGDYEFDKVTFNIKKIEIGVRGYVDAEQEEVCSSIWNQIARFTGGVIEFINAEMWECGDNYVEFTCTPNDVLKPLNAENFNDKKLQRVKKDNHRVIFDVILSKENSKTSVSQTFEWNISATADWLIAFDTLEQFGRNEIDSNHIPYILWKNVNEAFRIKSVEEFNILLSQTNADNFKVLDVNVQDYVQSLPLNKNNISFREAFNKLGEDFIKFAEEVCEQGFFTSISGKAVSFINSYVKLENTIKNQEDGNDFSRYLRCIANAFIIAEDTDAVEKTISIDKCIVLPYHPAMLEKIVAKMVFMRTGLAQWYKRKLENKENEKEGLAQVFTRLENLSSIHSAVDAFYGEQNHLMATNQVYGYFALYGKYKSSSNFMRMGSMLQKEAVYDEGFKNASFNQMNAEAKMIVNVIENYIRTYGQSGAHLSLVFVNPVNLQIIVSAIGSFVTQQKKRLGDEGGISLQMNITILQNEKNQGGRNYLAYWLSTILDMDENIRVEVFTDVWTRPDEIERKIQNNVDITFFMDVLQNRATESLRFNTAEDGIEQPLECRYPMVFKPAVDTRTNLNRTIELTQMQFDAAKVHTQVLSHFDNYAVDNFRVIQKIAAIDTDMSKVIESVHNKSIWVVCVDDALDRKSIQEIKGNPRCPIIGFSTGEGSFGQLNLTVTTRETIAEDIQKRCKQRLGMIFRTWSDSELEKASQVCIQRAGRLDGASVLLALNPSAYEINNYLAYLLLDDICSRENNNQVLIRLDSYRHWFDSKINIYDDEKKIPDFLLLSFKDGDDGKLLISADIIECKIAKKYNAEIHLEKAKTQVETGMSILSTNFDPSTGRVERRYWMSQLYRAVAFVQEKVDSDANIRRRLNRILDGDFEIRWNKCIYGFWFDRFDDEVHMYTDENDIRIYEIGQGEIQKILLEKQDADTVSYVYEIGAVEKSDEIIEEDELTENEEDEETVEDIGSNKIEVIIPYTDPVVETKVAETNGSEGYIQSEENTDSVKSQEEKSDKLEDIRVLLGKDKTNKDIYWEFGNRGLSNRHILLTGNSGQGKTYAIQTMLLELSRQNISSVIFDYTDGFMRNKLEPEFVDELGDRFTERVAIFNKIPINPFKRRMIEIPPYGSMPEEAGDVAGRLADILAHVYNFGDQQRAAIYSACRDGIEQYGDKMNFEYLRRQLEKADSSYAKTVLLKMAQFLDKNLFKSEEEFDWENITAAKGTVTVIQLTALDRQMQTIVTEIMLWDAWYNITKFGDKNRAFVVVLDEAQNLSFKEKSPAEKILREGRKYGWSAWFATQFLKGALDSGEISNLQQAAERLYFKPTAAETSYVAEQVADSKSEVASWHNVVKSLQKGHCIVQGDRVKPNGEFGFAKPAVVKITSLGDR